VKVRQQEVDIQFLLLECPLRVIKLDGISVPINGLFKNVSNYE